VVGEEATHFDAKEFKELDSIQSCRLVPNK
jgi:hypothetical protein